MAGNKKDAKDVCTDTHLSPETSPTAPKDIPIENIIELAAKGLSHRQIAKVVGCTKANITQRLRRVRSHLQGLKYYRENRSDVFGILEKRIIGSITDKGIQAEPVHKRVIMAEKLYNMGRLEEGKSTSNSAFLQVNQEDNEQLKQFLAEWTAKQLSED